MEKEFSKILIKLSAVFTFVMGLVFIALGLAALLFTESFVCILICIAGIFLLLFGAFAVFRILFTVLFKK